MSEIALKVLDDTIEYCAAKFAKEKSYPSDIENVILSRLYAYTVEKTRQYSWHVFTSEVHDPELAHLNSLHSNHDLLINDAGNKKDAGGVVTLNQSNVFLHFYTKRVCLFKVQGKEKRLEVIILHQTYEH